MARDLINSYKDSRKRLRKAYDHASSEDKTMISGMIISCSYVIKWLETGRQPINAAHVNKPSEERTVPWDPEWMNTIANPPRADEVRSLTEVERVIVRDALVLLSDRERQCFLLRHGLLRTNDEISKELQITKGTVQSFIERAESKIERYRTSIGIKSAG